MSIEGNKQFHVTAIKVGAPIEDGQLALINMYTLKTVTAEDVYVRTAYLAHNAIDRDGDVFDDALLERFAETLPGKGLFVKHPRGYDGDSGPGSGRWFDAHVVEMSHDEARKALRQPNLQWPAGSERAKLLETSFYIPLTESKQSLVEDVDFGVAGDVSIGFIAKESTPILDGAENVVAHRLHAPGEALEGSFVWLGAQPGARVHKSAKTKQQQDEDKTMTPEELAALQAKAAKADEHINQVTALQPKADAHDAMVKAVGEELAGSPETLKSIIDDHNETRAKLLDQIVAGERAAGHVEDSEEAVKAAKALYADWPMSQLEAMAKRYEGTADSGMGAGQPAARGAGEGEGSKLRDASVTQKALGTKAAA